MTAKQAYAAGYRIIRASACEWGLVYGDTGVRTWWASQLPYRPDLSHPLVREAIRANESMREDLRFTGAAIFKSRANVRKTDTIF